MTPRNSDRSLPDPNTEPTITVPRAGRILGMSRNASYAAARAGRFPTVPLSDTRVVVVTADFLEQYRLRRVPIPASPQVRPRPPGRPPAPDRRPARSA